MPAVRTPHVSCKCCAPSQTFETLRELNEHKKDQRGCQYVIDELRPRMSSYLSPRPICEWVVDGVRCGKAYRNSTNLKDHERKTQ